MSEIEKTFYSLLQCILIWMAFTALNEKERGENKTLCIVIKRCNENDSCQI